LVIIGLLTFIRLGLFIFHELSFPSKFGSLGLVRYHIENSYKLILRFVGGLFIALILFLRRRFINSLLEEIIKLTIPKLDLRSQLRFKVSNVNPLELLIGLHLFSKSPIDQFPKLTTFEVITLGSVHFDYDDGIIMISIVSGVSEHNELRGKKLVSLGECLSVIGAHVDPGTSLKQLDRLILLLNGIVNEAESLHVDWLRWT
jgi:hypothetical protein